ncbi:MAG TPA: hypothetical protein VLI04_15435 [Nocardioidaceae bacterium]|nr:hypothetical protein [Nocardioidaceae bacterium]
MTRYADPLRCPDCTNPIVYGEAACPACQLTLRGPLAQELFTTLSRADDLLLRLRLAVAPEPVPAAASKAVAAPMPASVFEPKARVATGSMSGTSVPKILLTLGAGCLLIAALVFLAVTWSVMGVGGRTATLVGFTAVAAGVTAVVAKKALRGAVEALGLVTLGLGALDVLGADNAGWLGDPSAAGLSVLLGLLLAGAATAGAVLLRSTPAGGFTAGEIVAGLGIGLACAGLSGGDWGSPEGRLLVATLVALAAVLVVYQLELMVAAVCAGAVAALSWLGLAATGFVRLVDEPTLHGVWQDLGFWPALVAALLVAAAAGVPTLPLTARQAAASVATAIAGFIVVVPGLDEGATEASLIAIAVVALASGVLLLPAPWNATGWLSLAVGFAGSTVVALYLLVLAAERWLEVASDGGLFGDRLPTLVDDLEPWLLPLAAAALMLATVAAVRPSRWERVLPAFATVTALATLTLYPVPVALLVGVALVAGAVFVVRHDLAFAGLLLTAALIAALHSEGLTVVALAVIVAAGAWVHLRDAKDDLRDVGAIVAQAALAASFWAWGLLLDQPGPWVAAIGLVAVTAVPLVRRSVGLELGAGFGAVGLLFAGAATAPVDDMATWIAVYLTLAGVATCALSLLRDDRRELGWVGGLLLAMATWVRLGDLGVQEPEPYTLPSALALLVVGLMHLRRNPAAQTTPALGAGLSLALVPSLLWVLAEPGTQRSALLGLACLALVVAGVQSRWTAPLAFGAAVGAAVVLRHAAPYLADSDIPRWVLIGFAGVLLVAMGVTWEQRVNEARRVLGYVRGLR